MTPTSYRYNATCSTFSVTTPSTRFAVRPAPCASVHKSAKASTDLAGSRIDFPSKLSWLSFYKNNAVRQRDKDG